MPKPLAKVRKRLLRAVGMKKFYQEKRQEGTDRKWRLIAANLNDGDRSLLDVGCNLGQLTYHAAELGMFALGVDAMPDAISRARRRFGKRENLAFAVATLTPESVLKLPRCDVTLCMSVHHVWHSEYGEDAAWRMVEALGERARKLFFEPASIHSKYGKQARPEFLELDEASIAAYVLAKFQSMFGSAKTIRTLGRTPCLGREHFRMLFLAQDAAAAI